MTMTNGSHPWPLPMRSPCVWSVPGKALLLVLQGMQPPVRLVCALLAARARGESDGLRDDLNAANEYAKKSRAAAERTASVATELLGRCTALYLGVAEDAARADSEARELRQAWPKEE
jgi:hypothetical protein